MPRGSEELTNARKEEIIHAMRKTLRDHEFPGDHDQRDRKRDIFYADIHLTIISRPKKKSFWRVFQQEYELWTGDLEELLRTNETFTGEGFAEAVALIRWKSGKDF